MTGGPVPDSLVAAITHRLDFLPKDVRTVLQAAALLGVEFLVSDLAIVMGCRVAELVRVIDEACTAGVLKDGKERLAFRHPLIRSALYDDIADAVRPAWHRDAARALAEAGAPTHRVARQLLQAISVPGAGPLDESLLDWLADAAPTLIAQAPRTAIELLDRRRPGPRRPPRAVPCSPAGWPTRCSGPATARTRSRSRPGRWPWSATPTCSSTCIGRSRSAGPCSAGRTSRSSRWPRRTTCRTSPRSSARGCWC